MSLHINDILTGLPVTPQNFDTRYMVLLPWEIMEIIWYYLPITTKIRTKKKYYERYHHLIYKEIRFFNKYMEDIIKNKYKYLFKLVVAEQYIEWTLRPPYFSNFYSYTTHLLAFCDTNKNPEFKQYLIHFKKEIAENKLKERETYKDYSFLHNIRNIWNEDNITDEITQKNSIEQK